MVITLAGYFDEDDNKIGTNVMGVEVIGKFSKLSNFDIALPYDKKVEMGKYSHEFIISKFDKKQVVKETIAEIMRD